MQDLWSSWAEIVADLRGVAGPIVLSRAPEASPWSPLVRAEAIDASISEMSDFLRSIRPQYLAPAELGRLALLGDAWADAQRDAIDLQVSTFLKECADQISALQQAANGARRPAGRAETFQGAREDGGRLTVLAEWEADTQFFICGGIVMSLYERLREISDASKWMRSTRVAHARTFSAPFVLSSSGLEEEGPTEDVGDEIKDLLGRGPSLARLTWAPTEQEKEMLAEPSAPNLRPMSDQARRQRILELFAQPTTKKKAKAEEAGGQADARGTEEQAFEEQIPSGDSLAAPAARFAPGRASAQMQMMLQESAMDLERELASELDDAHNLELKMNEVFDLIGFLTEHLSVQQEDLVMLEGNIDTTKRNVQAGNEELLRAKEHVGQGSRVMTVMIMILSFVLLYLDWFYS